MKSPTVKVELEFEGGSVDLNEVTHKGLQRLLRQAHLSSKNRSKPLHRRDEEEPEELDDDSREAVDENEKLVNLHAEKGSPAPIPVSDEDFSESVADTLPMKKPAKKKA